MSRGPRVPDGWTPADGHPDPRRDLFARAVSAGMKPSAAYRQHMAKAGANAKADSVKAIAFRIAREEPIKELIKYHRELHNARLSVDDETPLSEAELRALMLEVSAVLQEAHDVGEVSGVASEAMLAKVRRQLTVHVGRLARATTDRPDSHSKNYVLNVPNAAPAWCQCDE